MVADPNEWKNLARDPSHTRTKAELALWLPKTDRPAAPGSKHRVLSFDKKTGIAKWEGESVRPDDIPPGP
jgi:hypothetical protein